jgi:hypothetical protein
MMSAWRDSMQERSRQRMAARIKFPEWDEREERRRCLETLRELGIIDEDEFHEGTRALTNTGAPSGRAWELRTEARAQR